MDKYLEDLLMISDNYFIEIKEIETEIKEIDTFYFANNPDRYDKNCNCKICILFIDDPQ